MDFIIRPLTPADADAALALLADCSAKGEALYKPLEKADFLLRFFGENRWGFAAEAGGKLVGWAHAAAQTRFLPGETPENTPLYLTLLLVEEGFRRRGAGKALLEAVRQVGRDAGKNRLMVSGNNPVHLTWLIPGAGGHDHNNAPGANEDTPGYGYLLSQGFEDVFHEISMYMPLRDYRWDPKLDAVMEKLTAEGIYVGRWQMGMGENYDGMCDRVGSEYWRNVLRQELLAWHTGQPNADPECWPDGVRPAGPRRPGMGRARHCHGAVQPADEGIRGGGSGFLLAVYRRAEPCPKDLPAGGAARHFPLGGAFPVPGAGRAVPGGIFLINGLTMGVRKHVDDTQ